MDIIIGKYTRIGGEFKYSGKIVSSTRIRKCLKNGNIGLANKLLSRTWFIDGRVKKGKKMGRKLIFNLSTDQLTSLKKSFQMIFEFP